MDGVRQGSNLAHSGYSRVPTSAEHIEDDVVSSHSDDTVESLDESETSAEDLPAIADSIPVSAWLITAIEASERFVFWAIHGPLQNYIQLPARGGIRYGGLGWGQKNATLAKLLFTLWCYVTPICGAIIADQYLGRYRTILYSTVPYIVGLLILTGSATLIEREDSKIPAVGLVIALIAIGVGTGGIKANVSPLVAEQYKAPVRTQIRLQNGRKVRVDYDATIQRIFLLLYMFVNIGAFGALASAAVEQKFGFVPAYGLALIVFVIGTIILASTGRLYRKTPPAGSVLPNVIRILKIATTAGFDLDSAKPENLREPPLWDTELVDEVQQALFACRVFIFFPFWWCGYSQAVTNLISQAGTMRTGSIPNDILVYSNGLIIVIVAPIFDRIVYPCLNRCGISFSPLRRIAVGFFVCALAMAYTALLQRQIYLSPPCFDRPLAKSCEGGQIANDISVFWQLPIYLLIAISEVLLAVTGLEFAYASAPKSMKSLVTALVLCTTAGGMLMAMAFERIAEDPQMTWFYGSLAVEVLIGMLLFCYTFRHSLRSGKLKDKEADE